MAFVAAYDVAQAQAAASDIVALAERFADDRAAASDVD
jgi:hypothetical protein